MTRPVPTQPDLAPGTPECNVCGHPGLRPGGHAEWCERTAAWLRTLRAPGIPPCGTTGAARRHYRLGEAPCGPCREAGRVYRLAYNAARRSS